VVPQGNKTLHLVLFIMRKHVIFKKQTVIARVSGTPRGQVVPMTIRGQGGEVSMDLDVIQDLNLKEDDEFLMTATIRLEKLEPKKLSRKQREDIAKKVEAAFGADFAKEVKKAL
jgi:hypothetical protein